MLVLIVDNTPSVLFVLIYLCQFLINSYVWKKPVDSKNVMKIDIADAFLSIIKQKVFNSILLHSTLLL